MRYTTSRASVFQGKKVSICDADICLFLKNNQPDPLFSSQTKIHNPVHQPIPLSHPQPRTKPNIQVKTPRPTPLRSPPNYLSSIDALSPTVNLHPRLGHVCILQKIQWHPDKMALHLIQFLSNVLWGKRFVIDVT